LIVGIPYVGNRNPPQEHRAEIGRRADRVYISRLPADILGNSRIVLHDELDWRDRRPLWSAQGDGRGCSPARDNGDHFVRRHKFEGRFKSSEQYAGGCLKVSTRNADPGSLWPTSWRNFFNARFGSEAGDASHRQQQGKQQYFPDPKQAIISSGLNSGSTLTLPGCTCK